MNNCGKLQETFCRRAKFRTLELMVGLAMLAFIASPAQGQTVSWGPSVQLDDGFAPRIAASGTTVVQVHQGVNGTGPLWYRTAQLGPSGAIQWFGTGSLLYDNSGSAPSVAASGTTAVEVHQGDSGALWYRSGQIQLDGLIQWSASFQIDDGYTPSVAASGTTVVQVHQGVNGTGPLWYRTAHIAPDGTIQWFGTGSLLYDNSGSAPSVAIAGPTVIEVHQGNPGTLWYRTGQVQFDGTIKWGNSVRMDDGFAPSVTASGTTVVQVHQATNGIGPLWYRTGQLGRNGTIHWNGSGSVQYDNGFAPSVGTSGTAVVEIHQGSPGTLWSHSGQD
jgi:hypothetical protein